MRVLNTTLNIDVLKSNGHRQRVADAGLTAMNKPFVELADCEGNPFGWKSVQLLPNTYRAEHFKGHVLVVAPALHSSGCTITLVSSITWLSSSTSGRWTGGLPDHLNY